MTATNTHLQLLRDIIIIEIRSGLFSRQTWKNIGSIIHTGRKDGYQKKWISFRVAARRNGASLAGSGKIDISTQGIDAHLSREGVAQRILSRESQEPRAIFDLDPKSYKAVLLEYLMANNLPFSHVDRPSLAKLLSYVRRYETGEHFSETRHSMRAAPDEVNRYSLEKLKSRLAAHKGRFALTLDEWMSGKIYDSLVTLHFHNDDSVCFVIEFEVLNDDLSYTGEMLYGHLDRFLNEYDIKDRKI